LGPRRKNYTALFSLLFFHIQMPNFEEAEKMIPCLFETLISLDKQLILLGCSLSSVSSGNLSRFHPLWADSFILMWSLQSLTQSLPYQQQK
jgi:hypothetical protein